ncbi:hypothetical protein PHYPSEUDO_011878 [Phytophthora pseudosyringae]|uniref:Uncharacterized protein n=1 Tax=Phytophthora pseudosyringae TaxID=221518 RepID=A0A8T1VCP6_9STRA|nr:hypothetical protein PHYPSEUDO_011878 [Phytophthora pseudosyringae]
MRLFEEITSLEADGKLVVMSKKTDKEQTEKEKGSTRDKLMETAEKRLSERGKGAQRKVRETDKKRQRDETLGLIQKQLEWDAERLKEKVRSRELQQLQLEFERHKYEMKHVLHQKEIELQEAGFKAEREERQNDRQERNKQFDALVEMVK